MKQCSGQVGAKELLSVVRQRRVDQIEESAKAARSKGSFPPGLYEILDEAGYLFDFAWID